MNDYINYQLLLNLSPEDLEYVLRTSIPLRNIADDHFWYDIFQYNNLPLPNKRPHSINEWLIAYKIASDAQNAYILHR